MSSSKVILITGCSSGFGLLTAARLASHGHKVWATMRDLNKKEFLQIETARRGGAQNLRILALDVTQPDMVRMTVKEIIAQDGVIDVLINNAGYGVGGFFEDLSDADWRMQFDVNFFGVLNLTREVLPIMRPRHRGLIINISSMASFSGTPAFSAYCSSKSALEIFSESLYMEIHSLGIDVALVEPGTYRTKIFEDNARYAVKFFDPQSPYFPMSQRLKAFVESHIRSNRRDPEEVAVVVEDIINSPWPSFRNIVGIRSKLRYWIVRSIPFKLYAWLVDLALPSHA